MTTERYCPECGDLRHFEQPPCPDGHEECPEWCCTDCGHAIMRGETARPEGAAERAHRAA
jgi:hypothetical protein